MTEDEAIAEFRRVRKRAIGFLLAGYGMAALFYWATGGQATTDSVLGLTMGVAAFMLFLAFFVSYRCPACGGFLTAIHTVILAPSSCPHCEIAFQAPSQRAQRSWVTPFSAFVLSVAVILLVGAAMDWFLTGTMDVVKAAEFILLALLAPFASLVERWWRGATSEDSDHRDSP